MNPVPVELATIVASVVDELVCAHTLLEMKVAVAFCAALTISVHVDEVPLQAPVHPENANPLAGVAVKVTEVPVRYEAEHVPVLPVAHEIPPALEATLPLPEPVFVIDNT
jgi:hypothetical protein